MASLDEFKSKRTTIKGRLTRFKNKLATINKDNLSEEIFAELNERLAKIKLCWDEFDDVQSNIELLAPSDTDSVEREIFEDNYFSLVSNLTALCTEYSNNKSAAAAIMPSTADTAPDGNQYNQIESNNSVVKLPSIRLPTFDGQYCNWREFRDAFKALVDSNNSLQPIQKFYYLRSSLDKEASQVIKSIEVSAANYLNAWQLLEERFENKKLLIHNHIRSIFEYPSIKRESHTDLRNLFDNVTKHLRSLKALGEDTDSWDRLIIYVMAEKFDDVTRRDWETYKYASTLPSMKDMNAYLKEKCEVLEKLEVTKAEKQRFQYQHYKKGSSSSFVAGNNQYKRRCYYCNKEHLLHSCDSFLKLSINDRILAAKELKLCLNCLRDNHASWHCKSRKCLKCRKPHNSLLHLESHNANVVDSTATELPTDKIETRGNENNAQFREDAASSVVRNHMVANQSSHMMQGRVATVSLHSQILLSTAVIKIKINNEFIKCRVLLDSGSQSHFMTESLCKKLKLQPSKIHHVVTGVGQTFTNINEEVNVTIASCYNNFNVDIRCLILPRITEKLPMMSFNKNILNIPKGLLMADPDYNISGEVEMLLGSDVFWSILCSGQERLGPNLPILQNSQFGWIIAGNLVYNNKQGKNNNSSTSLNCFSLDADIDKSIQKFWQLEEVSNKGIILSKSEQYCEELFQKTTKRDASGRFIVNIPFKNSLKELGDSREMACNRFYTLEKRLNNNFELKNNYVQFMSEYEILNHMTDISNSIQDLTHSDGYFLPHHAVIKDTSLTTKCRVVFDASAKSSSGLSLNQVQHCGPNLNNDIFCILLRFRKYKYVITADISKMYRQILIEPEQRKYQQIFWRSNPGEELRCFELNTVTYGTASAPFLAIRCLHQLAQDVSVNLPNISKIIKNDFFMDDLLTGADTMSELLQIQKDISRILAGAGFELRKWLSNDKNILDNLEVRSDIEVAVVRVGKDENNKTLGIYWNSNQDVIQYSIREFEFKDSFTKREILSVICQIFDPLGLLGPVIVSGKLIMQELWKLKIGWDEVVPEKLFKQWKRFQYELPVLNDLKIPRISIISCYDYIKIEIHGFCDASERAYGAAIYCRCVLANGTIISNLLCSKSRVAPLKTISLPRLELCGAVLLTKLVGKTIDSLGIIFNSRYFWTDSTVTLAWINGEPSRWKTFVANRVSEIQSLTDNSEWNHVKSAENPADILSRGTSPTVLNISNKLWWQGPNWFFVDNAHWDVNSVDISFDVPEQKIVCNVSDGISDEINSLINKISSLSKIQRVLGYIVRFLSNCKVKPENRQIGVLTVNELESSLNLLIKQVQVESFSSEYNALLNKIEISKKSKLLPLTPFMIDGLIRVGGRLKNSKYSFEKKHPILLPKGHRLTKLIIESEHERLMHCGAQQLLYSVREVFWPISGKSVCKQVVRNCIICFRANPPSQPNYLMGNLPAVRVNECRPFLNVGVDYGGPFLLKDRKTRGARVTKAYVCLFVCMSTKAVHIELVSELTTEAFLATLNRFINRRGLPLNIYSDNASNFVGANNEISQISEFLHFNSEKISSQLIKNKINWHFIPANSPTFGGIWEAGIKRCKFHIKRVVGNNKLTFEEFNTVLVNIESILNSRPLSPLSPDPNDVSALTPAHFLIGETLTALPERSVLHVPENRLGKFQKLQYMYQHFWTRWHKEYVSDLQVRTRWKQNSQQLLKIGSLVLIKNDNLPPLQWQLGRVMKLCPGADGVVRVVHIKVTGGEVKRAVNRLCVLPID